MKLRRIVLTLKDKVPLLMDGEDVRNGVLPELAKFIGTVVDYQSDYPYRISDPSPRTMQLGLVVQAYLAEMQRGALLDKYTIIPWAAEQALERDEGRVLCFGLPELKPSQRKLLLALMARADSSFYMVRGKDGRVFAEDGTWLSPAKVHDLDSSRREEGRSCLFSEQKGGSEGLFATEYPTPTEEMRAVAAKVRKLLEEGAEPGRVAVLLPMRRKSGPLLRQVFNDYGIEVDLRVSEPLSASMSVSALGDMLEMVLDNFHREDMVRFLSSPYVRFDYEHGGEKVTLRSYEVDRFGREAGVLEGAESWQECLAQLMAEKRVSLASPEMTAERAQRTEAAIGDIERVSAGVAALIKTLGGTRENSTPKAHVAALMAAASAFGIRKRLHFRDERLRIKEARAQSQHRRSLQELADGAAAAGIKEMSFEQFCRQHEALLENEEFQAGKKDLSKVQVAGLRAAAMERYDHILIPGLIEGDIPRLTPDYPFATEEEAKEMGVLQPKDILRTERYYFLLALLNAEEGIHLSCARMDGRRTLLPSSFFEAAIRNGARPEGRERDDGSRLMSHLSAGMAIAGKKGQEDVFLPLKLDLDAAAARMAMEEGRKGPYCGAHDAILTECEGIAASCSEMHAAKVYSPRMLDTYIGCPFEYFLRYVLLISPPWDEEEGEPILKGMVFHRIAWRFLTERRERGEHKISAEAEALRQILAIGAEELDRMARRDVLFEGLRLRMLGGEAAGMLHHFVRSEAADAFPTLRPRFLELAIGTKPDGDGRDAASLAAPVEIPLGEGEPASIRLRCAVDRVDADDQGRFVVLDYKTGGSVPSARSVAEGKALQIPLYLLAVEAAFPGMRGVGGGYYMIGRGKDTGVELVLGDAPEAAIFPNFQKKRCLDNEYQMKMKAARDSVRMAVQGMSQGIYHPCQEACARGPACDYYAVCRFDLLRLVGGEE
jgi:ATP-dependent helicase/DNAse subunit B